MGKADLLMKVFFSNPYVFADVFNFWLHDGAQIIQPENLKEASESLISLTEKYSASDIDNLLSADNGSDMALPDIESDERLRDVLMHWICMEDGESVYALLGIEGQTYVDYGMAARALIYDARQYDKQLKAIRDGHKAKGETGNTPGEFLWRFFKTDHLVPVITVVVYLGSDEWDGPRTLHDMFQIKNPALISRGINYELNLIEPRYMSQDEIEKFRSNMREVMLYLKASVDERELLKLATEKKLRDIDRVTAHLINEVSQSKLKFEKSEKGKEKIDMCKAIEGIMQMGIEQGSHNKAKTIVLNLAASGMSIPFISEMTEESEETIQEWLAISSTN